LLGVADPEPAPGCVVDPAPPTAPAPCSAGCVVASIASKGELFVIGD
jgi:hypothetical protein